MVLVVIKKVCSKCLESKSVESFYYVKGNLDSRSYACKVCSRRIKLEKRRTKEGLIKGMYDGQMYSSKCRGYAKPDYSKKELICWVLSKSVFHSMYDDWVSSNYTKDFIPSLDRIDDYKSYSFENIQLMTWKANREKAYLDMKNGVNNKRSKAVSQYTVDGVWVADHHSVKEAARKVNGLDSDIINVCKKAKRKLRKSCGSYRYIESVTAYGFKWRYHGELL